MNQVDARGLSCPIPVVRTRKAMKADPNTTFTVLVDEMTQVENVTRLGNSNGYEVEVEDYEGAYMLTLTPR